MKKILALTLAVMFALFAFAGCGSNGGDEDATKPASEQTDKILDGQGNEVTELVVGFDAEFPPFGFVAEDGSYDGFDLAVAKEVADRLGIGFKATPIDWNSKDTELNSGTINCIWNGFTYNGRETEYTWSDCYYDATIVVVVKADSGIKALADLAGKTVMVQEGSSGLDALNSDENKSVTDSFKKLVTLPDYNSGFMELEQGSVDAVVADYGVAAQNMSKKEGQYIVLDDVISKEQYAVGFKLGNVGLCEAVNDKLHEIAADGTMNTIAQKYVDSGLVLESIILK